MTVLMEYEYMVIKVKLVVLRKLYRPLILDTGWIAAGDAMV